MSDVYFGAFDGWGAMRREVWGVVGTGVKGGVEGWRGNHGMKALLFRRSTSYLGKLEVRHA